MKKVETKKKDVMSLKEKIRFIKDEMIETQVNITSWNERLIYCIGDGDVRMEYGFRIDIKSEVAKLNILEEEFTKLTNQI
jgi:hypothetical protein